MRFIVNAMEVIRRRNKRSQPGDEDWENHDQNIILKHTNKAGCRASYQYSSTGIRTCSTKEDMKTARFFFLRSDDYNTIPPCRSMDKLIYTYEEDDLNLTEYGSKYAVKGSFWIGIYLFNEKFKEIVHTR